jgi:hypothetical protein
MRRRDLQVGLAVLIAAALGFVVALILLRDDSTKNAAAVVTTNGTVTTTTATTTTTTPPGTTAVTTTTATTPRDMLPTTASCVALWNEPANSAARLSLRTIASSQPVRVHVGQSADVPPECLITVIANNGDAYIYAEGGGATYPYAPQPGKTTSSSLHPEQRTANALEQGDGSLQAR